MNKLLYLFALLALICVASSQESDEGEGFPVDLEAHENDENVVTEEEGAISENEFGEEAAEEVADAGWDWSWGQDAEIILGSPPSRFDDDNY